MVNYSKFGRAKNIRFIDLYLTRKALSINKNFSTNVVSRGWHVEFPAILLNSMTMI